MPQLGLGLSLAKAKSSGFSPKKISGLSLWLDASKGLSTTNSTNVDQIIITGATGTYSGTNGTYSLEDENFWVHQNGAFNIAGENLQDSDSGYIIATNSNNYQGAWTPAQYFSTVTLSSAGNSLANGVYTRTDTAIDVFTLTFSKSGGATITYDTESGLFINTYGYYNDNNLTGAWTADPGTPPAPTAVYSNSNRNTGSITSTVTFQKNLTSWDDQSGNNLNFSSATSGVATSNPRVFESGKTYNLPQGGVSSGISSRASIGFLNSLMLSANTNIGTTSNGFSVFIVGYSRGDFETNGHGGDLQAYINYSDMTTAAYDSWVFGAYGGPSTDFSDSAWVSSDNGSTYETSLYSNATYSPRVLTYLNGSGSISIYSNGTLQSSASAPQPQALNKPIGIGNRSVITQGYLPGPRENFDGMIGEVIIYNRKLSNQDRIKVEEYLRKKYALY